MARTKGSHTKESSKKSLTGKKIKKQGNPGKWGGKPLEMLESFAPGYMALGRDKKSFWKDFFTKWYATWPPLATTKSMNSDDITAKVAGESTDTNETESDEIHPTNSDFRDAASSETGLPKDPAPPADQFELFARTIPTEVCIFSFSIPSYILTLVLENQSMVYQPRYKRTRYQEKSIHQVDVSLEHCSGCSSEASSSQTLHETA